MWEKLRGFPLTAFISVKGFFRAFSKDERGLSGVVVAILLILVAVLAIVLIWGFLSGWLVELWEKIFGQGTKIDLQP